jgi:hypothetical protein
VHPDISYDVARQRAADVQLRATSRNLAVASGRDLRSRLVARLVALADRTAVASQHRRDHAAGVVQPRFG